MFKRYVAGLMLLCSPLFAGELSSLDAITQTLDKGEDVTVVIHASSCSIDDPNDIKIPATNMVVKPTSVLFTDKMVSIDAVKYASGRAPLPSNGLIQRATLLLNNQGQASMVIAFFDGETNKKLPEFKDVKLSCQLGSSVHVYA